MKSLYFFVICIFLFAACSYKSNTYKEISLNFYKTKMLERCKLIKGPKKRENNATFYSFKTIEEECIKDIKRTLTLDKINFIENESSKMLLFCENKKDRNKCIKKYQETFYSNKVGIFFNEKF